MAPLSNIRQAHTLMVHPRFLYPLMLRAISVLYTVLSVPVIHENILRIILIDNHQ